MVLAVLGVAAGVATFSSLRAAQATLVDGLTARISELSGGADLQVTGVGGVPELLFDRLVRLPGVGNAAPVIEEVVQLEPPGQGSVLILGVDLIGDRSVREYRFEGADADVDDPLVFLAQPDSVAVSGTLADRLHLRKGDGLTVRVETHLKRLVVRAVLAPGQLSQAFDGAIVITDVYAAQELLGRGRRFDRIDVKAAEDGGGAAEMQRVISAVIGAGYRVETPASRGDSLHALIRHYDASFTASRIVGVVIAGFLIFNVFTVGVQRRRREIGILRTLGATSYQIQRLLLTEALLLGCAGGVAGLLLGRMVAAEILHVMRGSVEYLYHLTTVGEPMMSVQLVGESIGLGVLAALVGAWVPVRAACRVTAVEALATGTFAVRRSGLTRRDAVIIVAAVVTAASALARPPENETLFLFLALTPPCVVFAVIARPLSELLLALAARVMLRLGPLSNRVAMDALRSQPARTATATTGIVLVLTFALGVGGHMRALDVTFSSLIERAFRADLYVRASSGFAPSTVRLPWTLGDDLAHLPGVGLVTGLRYDIVPLQGREVMLAAADIDLLREWLRHDLTEGSSGFSGDRLDRDDVCLISDNLARQRHLHTGDRVTLDTPEGQAAFTVGAVIDVLLSEFGVVLVNRHTFERYWRDDRVDVFRVTFAPGADREGVTRAVEGGLTSHPALVTSRAQIVADAGQAIDSFIQFTRITAFMAAAVAFINVVTALLISVAERTRELAILKTLGAVRRQIMRVVLVEAIIMTMGGLALAAPLAVPLAWFLSRSIMETYFGFYVAPSYDYELLLLMAVSLPVVATLAAWLPARRAAAAPAVPALAHE
jgi:putative ABC transport system permease protein